MNLFDDIIAELRQYVEDKKAVGIIREEYAHSSISWPSDEKGNVVLQSDTGLELGNPRDESVSFLVWTNDLSLVKDGLITLAGTDITGCNEKNMPFGKVVIIGGNDFNEENCYERYREIELVRYELNLKGYMMRAASQYMREWSRISREAINNGFSLSVLGSGLIEKYMEKDYVKSAEILFINSSSGDVKELKGIGDRAMQYINAMTTMTEEMSFDCDTCDYLPVCSEVDDLRKIRDSLNKDKK